LNKLSEWSSLHAEQCKSGLGLGADELAVRSSTWHPVRFVKKQHPTDDTEERENFGGRENSLSRSWNPLKSSSMPSSTNSETKETQDFNILPVIPDINHPVRQNRQGSIYHIQNSPVHCGLPNISRVSDFDGTREIGSLSLDLATEFAKPKKSPSVFLEVLNNAIAVANSQPMIHKGKSSVKTSASSLAKNLTQPKKGKSKRKVPAKKNSQNPRKGKANVEDGITPHLLYTKNIVSSKRETPSAYSDLFNSQHNFPSKEDSLLRHPGYLQLNTVNQSASVGIAERRFDQMNRKNKDQVDETSHNSKFLRQSTTSLRFVNQRLLSRFLRILLRFKNKYLIDGLSGVAICMRDDSLRASSSS